MRTITNLSLKTAIFIIVLTGCLFPFKTNGKWAFRKLRSRVTDNESVWMKTKHGDLAAYSDFLKKHLFEKDYAEHVLIVPDNKGTNARFVRKLWLGVPPLYLFPIKVTVSEKYQFEITKTVYFKLKSLPLTTKAYKDRRYHIVDGLRVDDFKDWAMYIFDESKYVHVFTLPKGYMDL